MKVFSTIGVRVISVRFFLISFFCDNYAKRLREGRIGVTGNDESIRNWNLIFAIFEGKKLKFSSKLGLIKTSQCPRVKPKKDVSLIEAFIDYV